jgi:hypothetical protein
MGIEIKIRNGINTTFSTLEILKFSYINNALGLKYLDNLLKSSFIRNSHFRETKLAYPGIEKLFKSRVYLWFKYKTESISMRINIL